MICFRCWSAAIARKLKAEFERLEAYPLPDQTFDLAWTGFENDYHQRNQAGGLCRCNRYRRRQLGRYFEVLLLENIRTLSARTGLRSLCSPDETTENIEALGEHLCFFGLGCRNVSKAFVPEGYDLTKLLSSWDRYKEHYHHHKYCNNYDYQKSILLVNSVPFLDNGFILLQQNERLVSLSRYLYYEYYRDQTDLETKFRTRCW